MSGFSEGFDQFIQLIKSGNFIILDTETTGLINHEICQIAIINAGGDVLLDTLVQTANHIPMDATRIHGIADAHVAGKPRFSELVPTIADLIRGKQVVTYNAPYDRQALVNSHRRYASEGDEWVNEAQWRCAMAAYAEFYGDFSSFFGSYKLQKLTHAATRFNIDTEGAHGALADCKMTLGVCMGMVDALHPPDEGEEEYF